MSQATQLGYDADNRATSAVRPDEHVVTAMYSNGGDLVSVTPPGRPAHQFGYTAAGDVQLYSPPSVSAAPPETTYAYNLDREPTTVVRPDGQTISMTYDSAGRPSTTSYPAGTETRIYSPTSGRLVQHVATDGGTLDYTYDGTLPLTTTWSGTVAGTVGRTWNSDFQISSESVNGGSTVAYAYDADGLILGAGAVTIVRDLTNGHIAGTTLGNVTDSRSYDVFGQRSDFDVRYAGNSIFQTHQVIDKAGRAVERTETIAGVEATYDYSYDPVGRLSQVRKDDALIATYVYNANGNRLSRATPAVTEVGTYDDQDRLMTYGKWSYTYSLNGELRTKTDTTNSEMTTYSYDAVGNLRRVDLPDGRTIEYVIDGMNRRIGKKVGGSLVKAWLYRSSLTPVAELDGGGTVISRFVFATSGRIPNYMVKGGSTYRVIADDIGTPRLIVDVANGNVAQARTLDEFGNVVSDTAPDFQPFGFASGLYDPDTGLVRFGVRDYDPVPGRWISKDPARFLFGTNLYAYVENDPINGFDPTGLTRGDQWYGFNDRNFQNWVHRQMKDSGQADFTKQELKQLYEDWKAQGKPGGDKSNKPKRGGGRRCEDPPEPMSDPDSDPDYDLDPEPDPEPGNDNNNERSRFQGSGPWNEDGTPVNPDATDWYPLPGSSFSPPVGNPGSVPVRIPIRIPIWGM